MRGKQYWCIACATIFACLFLIGVGILFTHIPVVNESSQGDPPATEREATLSSFETGILSRLRLPVPIPFFSKKREVLSFIVENHEDARPFQKGLESAFLIQEFLVEGMISRFVVYVDRSDFPKQIGPIRSLRPYFLSGIVPWSSALFYAGGSPEALEQVLTFPTLYAFNGLGLPNHFLRDPASVPPHDLFVDREHVEDLLKEKDLHVTDSNLFSVGGFPSGSGATKVFVQFFNPDHNVTYIYDALGGGYIRTNGHLVQDARPSNVLMMEVPITDVGEYGRLVMDTIGSGPILLFRNGKVQSGTWVRAFEDQPYLFLDADGSTLLFSKGQIWMMVLPTLERVEWSE
ncbi:hypothetical protein COU77_03125 [Candidatus Peregrinibacteria bacterium CG10_big_fil_rev_8_21_14_0_10_49_16]|nr:MAG: hypothetical protein COW95_02640 [Candidatus Peregrinibacteria bacterium CG22_combo_CG10-13_8_21_14_all_49_11]PIR52026.1 MAG: hypothetical protein COU77_03125 [Candidatus Peregrinibacteria bacterium CG10_big_fil_rev_8_21_14_0_10_49_16]